METKLFLLLSPQGYQTTHHHLIIDDMSRTLGYKSLSMKKRAGLKLEVACYYSYALLTSV